jgi:hypothetical protein
VAGVIERAGSGAVDVRVSVETFTLFDGQLDVRMPLL